MNISADMVEYIRTMVNGDHDANDAVEVRLDNDGWGDFATLLNAVFFLAIDRRLGEDAGPGEIVKFIAEIRSNTPIDPSYIDANSAEALVSSALDPSLKPTIDPEMKGRIQGATIVHVLGASDVTDADREAVYSEALQMVARL
jgi:hypothetical protein